MKIIHCADLHLDSKMNANLNKDQIRERRAELLHTFERLITYAREHRVTAILIAGDLFDTKNVSANARNTVADAILSNPEITFFYLRGNHDSDNFLANLEQLPENLKLFEDQWKQYLLGNVVISGLELTKENAKTAGTMLVTDADQFNIVMLHGQETQTSGKDRAEIIDLREFKNRGIDYLALGHIHGYKMEALDARGSWCYPGCLEGRGFDECGEHGFVLLDIEEASGKYTHTFVPFANRQLYTETVDVSGCLTSAEMMKKIREHLERTAHSSRSLLKIVLKGAVDVECEKDLAYLTSSFEQDYYFVKIYDETSWKVDIETYLLDESLKGEFVRSVMNAKELNEEEQAAIIRYGLQAIAGEEMIEV